MNVDLYVLDGPRIVEAGTYRALSADIARRHLYAAGDIAPAHVRIVGDRELPSALLATLTDELSAALMNCKMGIHSEFPITYRSPMETIETILRKHRGTEHQTIVLPVVSSRFQTIAPTILDSEQVPEDTLHVSARVIKEGMSFGFVPTYFSYEELANPHVETEI